MSLMFRVSKYHITKAMLKHCSANKVLLISESKTKIKKSASLQLTTLKGMYITHDHCCISKLNALNLTVQPSAKDREHILEELLRSTYLNIITWAYI